LVTEYRSHALIRREGLPRRHAASGWVAGESAVTALAPLVPAGLLVAGGFDGRISIWTRTGDRTGMVETGGSAITVLCASDSLLAAADFSGVVHLGRVSPDGQLEPLRSWKAHSGTVRAMEFVDDRLVTASHDGTVHVWSLPSGVLDCSISPYSAPVTAMCADGEHDRLYLAVATGQIHVVPLRQPGAEPRVIAALDEPVSTLVRLEEGRGLLAGTTGHRLVRLGYDGAELCRAAERAPSWPTSMVVDERRQVALVSGADLTTRLWNLADLTPCGLMPGDGASMGAIALWPDGALHRGDDRGVIRQLHIDTDPVASDGHEGSIWSVAIDPKARWVLSAGSDNSVRVWDVSSGQEVKALRGHDGWVNSVAFSRDGRTAGSVSSDGSVRVWEVGTWRHIQTMTGHTGWINGVALSGDGRTVVTGSSDGTMRLWDVETGGCGGVLSGHDGWINAVAYSSRSGVALSASSDCTVRVWDVARRSTRAVLKGHEQGVTSVHLSDDGRRALSAGYDGVMTCWDLAGGGTRTWAFDHHVERVWVVSADYDGHIAVTAGGDATLRLWDIGRRKSLNARDLDAPVTACAMLDIGGGSRLVAYGQRDGMFGLIKFDL
jgi:WD40 repeat protein